MHSPGRFLSSFTLVSVAEFLTMSWAPHLLYVILDKTRCLMLLCGDSSGCGWQGHPEEVYGCEFLNGHGNSLQLATGSSENVYLWDVATAALLGEAGPPTDLRDTAGGTPLLGHLTTVVYSLKVMHLGSLLQQRCKLAVLQPPGSHTGASPQRLETVSHTSSAATSSTCLHATVTATLGGLLPMPSA